MPQLTASGEIFRLDASAGFDEGIVRGQVGAGARLKFRGQFELCHGLRGALSAEAVAEAHARLASLFLLAGYAEGEAVAAAGLEVDAAVQLDLFDSYGLSANAAAFAELALAGRVAAGLTFEDIARAARPLLSDLPYDLLIYFLNEVDAVAGVWGKVAFAAMAKARVKLQGSLANDKDAGFACEVGAEVGAGAGGGYEFYAALRFRNPKRFYLNAAERVTRELTTTARRMLPPETALAIEGLELALPIALNSAYELGQALPLNTLLPPEQAIAPFIANCGAQLQRYALDKLAEGGIRLLEDYLKLITREAVAQLSSAQRATARDLIETLIQQLRQPNPPPPLEALGKLIDVLTLVAPARADEWRRPLTITWLSLASAEALRTAVGQERASASATMVGLGTAAASTAVYPLPTPPRVVRRELDAFFEPDPPRLEFSHAARYLGGSGASLVCAQVPGLKEMLQPLLNGLGLRAEELIEAAIEATFGRNLAALNGDVTALYRLLRGLLKSIIDNKIQRTLLPELRRLAGSNHDATIWADEVAEPCLGLLSNFVFDRLDALVEGRIRASNVSPFATTFRAALSAMMGEIIIRNAVVTFDIIREHAFDSLERGLRDTADNIRSSTSHPVALAARETARPFLPLGIEPSNYPQLAANMAADVLDAAAAGLGPGVYTDSRRALLRDLQRQLLLSVDGNVDYRHGDQIEAFFSQVAECLYIPNPVASVELVKLQATLLAEQAQQMLPKLAAALRRFYEGLGQAALNDLNRVGQIFLDEFDRRLQEAWDAIQWFGGEILRLAGEIEEAAENLANGLNDVESALRSSRRRGDILDAAKEYGMDVAEQFARAVPGFGALHPNLQRAAVDAARNTFGTGFDLARPALDEALKVVANIAGGAADIIMAATSFDDAIADLAARVRNNVEAEVNRQLRAFNLSLPDELNTDDVARIARNVIRDLDSLRDAVRACMNARQAKAEAESSKRTAAIEKARAQLRHDAVRRTLDEETAGNLRVVIQSPAPLAPSPQFNWVYGGHVRVRAVFEGARPGFVEPPPRQRIWLAVNGTQFNPPPQGWTPDADGLRLDVTLPPSSLRRGVNVLECSVVDGRGHSVRATCTFVYRPDARPSSLLEVNAVTSTLTSTPTRPNQEETLVLVNRSGKPLDLQGWSVADEDRNRFVFPALRVPKDGEVKVVTGFGTPKGNVLHWPRTDVWEKNGDTVYVVDPAGLLRHEYSFGGSR
jgi:hypothetical protein